MEQICERCNSKFESKSKKRFCSTVCQYNRKKIACQICGYKFYVSKNAKTKFCSNECRHKAGHTKETKLKIGKKSKQKFIDKPELRKISAENGRRNMKALNESGKAFRMPKGYHTEEYKKYMSRIMTGREITWNDKIKENHWSKSENRDDIIDKIITSRKDNESWNSYQRRNQLANWCMNNPDKSGNNRYHKGWYNSKLTGLDEFYQSGLELKYMELFDHDDEVVHWTKGHGISIPYLDLNGKERLYYPDFLVEYKNGSKKIIETKGYIPCQEILEIKISVAEKYANDNDIIFEIIYE